MAFPTPYVTDKYTAYADDIIITNLSFTIWLIDDYTKSKPIGSVQVEIKEIGKKAVRNLSGFYCFTDLVAGSYAVSIRSGLYFSEEINIDVSPFPVPKNHEIALKPKPEYPFPDNATLVRGQIESKSNKPVSSVKISVGKDIKTVTDSRGEFVIYLGAAKQEEKLKLRINSKIRRTITVKERKTVFVEKISIS